MASSAAALGNVRDTFIVKESGYLGRITMTASDAVPRESERVSWRSPVKPEWLRDIASRLVEFTRLPHDWDLEGGDPVDPSAARSAFAVIRALGPTMTLPPDIVPVGDGAVTIEWHTPSVDLEIEIGPDSEGSIFFRDRPDNREFHSTRLKTLLGSLSRLEALAQPTE
jgi:hypothetical protein